MMELPERFWNKVQAEPNSGCWLWDGAINSGGYGHFRQGRKVNSAHRVSYEALVGPIPNGLGIDHLCRVRNCVNPDHMEPVTSGENSRRGVAGKRGGERMLAKTHCPQGHPYFGENLYITPDGRRRCRECNRVSNRRWWRDNKKKGKYYRIA